MAQLILNSDQAKIILRHRAYCENDNWKSNKWRETLEEAWNDAGKHLDKPGNSEHVVYVITEQRTIIKYTRQ